MLGRTNGLFASPVTRTLRRRLTWVPYRTFNAVRKRSGGLFVGGAQDTPTRNPVNPEPRIGHAREMGYAAQALAALEIRNLEELLARMADADHFRGSALVAENAVIHLRAFPRRRGRSRGFARTPIGMKLFNSNLLKHPTCADMGRN